MWPTGAGGYGRAVVDPEVRAAYGERADEYVALFGSIEATDAADRALVRAWAREQDGPVLDLGCGPGQWTAFLAAEGLAVTGIDPVDALLDHARRAHPDLAFESGSAQAIDRADGAVGGVLAWYSLIHSTPEQVAVALAELARVIRPGGGLLLGHVVGPETAVFDHAVARAWHWPPGELAALVASAGFAVTAQGSRVLSPTRVHGDLRAVRLG